MAAENSEQRRTMLLDLPEALLMGLLQAISISKPSRYVHSLICRKFKDISLSAQSAVKIPSHRIFQAQELSEMEKFANLSRMRVGFCASESVFQDLLIAAPSWNLLQAFQAFYPSNSWGFTPRQRPPEELLTSFFEGCRGLLSLELWSIDCDIPPSISSLVCLKELTLLEVGSLPPNFGDLKQLRSFRLHSSADVLPSSVNGLSTLQDLTLEMSELRRLPEAIGELKRLRSLDLTCLKLESFPWSFGALTRLRRLRLTKCRSLISLPADTKNFSSLRALTIPNVRDLELLTNLPGLRMLRIHPSHSLNVTAGEIPGTIGELPFLRSLTLRGLHSLHCLPQQLSCLTQLTRLNILWCKELKQVDPITTLCSLEELYIDHCDGLESLPEDLLHCCPALGKVTLLDLCRLRKLPEGVTFTGTDSLRTRIGGVAAQLNDSDSDDDMWPLGRNYEPWITE